MSEATRKARLAFVQSRIERLLVEVEATPISFADRVEIHDKKRRLEKYEAEEAELLAEGRRRAAL